MDDATEVEKIEITPEMIERGVEAFLANRSLEFESAEEAVEIIIKAVLGDRALNRQGQIQ